MDLATSLWGIFFALLTVLFNVSPILQKDALDGMPEISFKNIANSLKTMFTHRGWLWGFLLGNMGGIFYAIAVFLIGVTVVEPSNNAGFIILVIAAARYLKEEIHFKEYLGILLLMIMPLFLILSRVSEPTHDVTQWAVQSLLLWYTIIILIIVAGLFAWTPRHPILWTGVSSLLMSLSSIYLQACMSFITFAGYDLFRDLGVMFSRRFSDPNLVLALTSGALSILFGILFTYCMQITLQKIPASKCIPITQTIDNLAVVAVGIVVFGQQVGSLLFYGIALATSLFGSIVLGKYQNIVKK